MAGQLDPKVVDALLDKLSSDDAFRELFARDPNSALAELGDRTSGGACLSVAKLASKEAIKAARDELRKSLMSQATQQPHKLEA